MTDFVWPSDEHRAENRELDYVCDYLEDTLDKLDALRATNRDLQDRYENTSVELRKARVRVAELERDVAYLEYLDAEVRKGAELAADEIASLKAKLEELEALRAPVILRKQAEALEAMAEKIRNDTRGTNTLWEMLIVMDVEAQELRKKAEVAERVGGEK
jgi:DNA repair exonuclease SbcCD ATPase subunit